MLSTRSGEAASDEDGKRVYGGFPIGGHLCGWEIFVGDDRDGDTGGYYIYLKKIDLRVLIAGSSMRPDFSPS